MGNFMKHIHPLLRRSRRKDAHEDSNFAILNALENVLSDTEKETIQSKVQSSLETATGDFLDGWGDWFGIYRSEGEDDNHYRAHIIEHTLLHRGTIQSIIDAIKWFLKDNNAQVEIYEPWRNIFYTNSSKLNGEDHMTGFYYRFAILDITIGQQFPPEIRTIIQAFKPAGVMFYLSYDSGMDLAQSWVETPYSEAQTMSRQELDRLTGSGVNLKGVITPNDLRREGTQSDIFHTNRSKLNGVDVLGGDIYSGREYLHLYGTTGSTGTFILGNTQSMFEIEKSPYGEEGVGIKEFPPTSYTAVQSLDSRVDFRSTQDRYLYLILDIRGFLVAQYAKEYKAFSGQDADVVNKEQYSLFLNNPTLSYTMSSLAPPTSLTQVQSRVKDFSSGRLQELATGSLGPATQSSHIGLGTLQDYLNEEGLVLFEFELTNNTTTPVHIDYINLTFNTKLREGYDIVESLEVSNETTVTAL